MRIIKLVLTLALVALAPRLNYAAAGGNASSVRAILFTASNDKGPSDPKLASYEPVLRSNLRFETFRYVSEGSASVAVGASATITLGSNRVVLERDKSGGPPQVHFGHAVVDV